MNADFKKRKIKAGGSLVISVPWVPYVPSVLWVLWDLYDLWDVFPAICENLRYLRLNLSSSLFLTPGLVSGLTLPAPIAQYGVCNLIPVGFFAADDMEE